MTEPRVPELEETDDAPDDEQPEPRNDTPEEPAPEHEGDKPATQDVGLGGLT